MQPHVFVAMPFDVKEVQAAAAATEKEAAKEAIKVDFNEVYALLHEPALKRAGCVPFRADKEKAGGDIRTDMFFELVTADIIVADVSMLNANVFYELGIRHGVAPRGVFMVEGGWAKLKIFDLYTDRKFSYDGKLFLTGKEERDADWQQRLDAEVEQLANRLRDAIAADEQTIGSPVYKELPGLKPADWSEVRTARANYFGNVFADWESRVKVAAANGWAGDILTLADDAPTRFHRTQLLWRAAGALRGMKRFAAALTVLDDLLALDGKHLGALTQRGLVLNRLGRVADAQVHMLNVVKAHEGDTEAQGILGRVYKDLWKVEWQDGKTVEERQQLAVAASVNLVGAVESYEKATRAKFDYYNGINVISAVKLLEHLAEETGDQPAEFEVPHFDEFVSVIRYSALTKFDCAGPDDEERVWVKATLAELELVAGDAKRAYALYREAAYSRAATHFSVSSMLEQVRLFESLNFRPDAVAPVVQLLRTRLETLTQRGGGASDSGPRFGKVVAASGHMTDAPDRVKKGRAERFPERKVDAVRAMVARQLDKWGVGAGDLAICGGARGADLIFAELCADRGAQVWLFLAKPEGDFLDESVRSPGTDWADRFYALKARDSVKTFFQHERLRSPPKGASVFARNNLWMINTARVEADEPKNLYAVLVWDEQPTGDGPGGTSDFAARVKRLGGHLCDPIVNPTKL
ncbi:MAG TPA: tetratricopeptide repeat-containing protein [Pyrinomonadaceae bacterium]|nr:tetratricopeptide repeat-containing protein [Pyrinomonadaceae bacterium]